MLFNSNHQIINRKDIGEKFGVKRIIYLGRILDIFITRLRKYLRHGIRISFGSIHGIGFRIEMPD